jgi:hypothetical protein
MLRGIYQACPYNYVYNELLTSITPLIIHHGAEQIYQKAYITTRYKLNCSPDTNNSPYEMWLYTSIFLPSSEHKALPVHDVSH